MALFKKRNKENENAAMTTHIGGEIEKQQRLQRQVKGAFGKGEPRSRSKAVKRAAGFGAALQNIGKRSAQISANFDRSPKRSKKRSTRATGGARQISLDPKGNIIISNAPVKRKKKKRQSPRSGQSARSDYDFGYFR